MTRASLVALAGALLATLAIGDAAAQELGRGRGAPLEWRGEWERFGAWNYALTGAALATVGVGLIAGPGDEARRSGGVWLDDDVRDGLRLRTKRARQDARDTSDVLLAVTTSYPYLFDSLLVASWYRASPDVGVQMALITTETLAVTLALQTTTNMLVGRERPYVRECGGAIDGDAHDCVADNRFQSFFSGHTSQAFAVAALTCAHHANVPLHGGGAAEAVPCAGGFLAAATTGALRVAADQHYATDVITGALVGTTAGFTVPLLLHYRSSPSRRAAVSVALAPMPGGLAAVGTFR